DGFDLAETQLGIGYGHGRNRVGLLPRKMHGFPARGQYDDVAAILEKLAGQLGAGAKHVLAIVEDEEQTLVGELPRDGAKERHLDLLKDPERRGHDDRNARGIDQRGKIHQPGTVWEDTPERLC